MNFLEKFKLVDTFIFDVDGVLTNGELMIQPDGALLRKMFVKDGYALQHAVKQGYKVAIISGGKPLGVEQRLSNLGIEDMFYNSKDKKATYLDYVRKNKLDPEGIVFMGDDLPDYEVMRLVGIPASPNDAAIEIQEVSQYVSPFNGGCLLYTSPSPRDLSTSRMPSSA